MTPELKAFRHYRKNINYYLSRLEPFQDDLQKLFELYCEIAEQFGGDGRKLMDISMISYYRSVERAFR